MIGVVEEQRWVVSMDERCDDLGWMKQEWWWKIPERCAVGWVMKRAMRMKMTRHHSKPGRTSST